MARKSGGFLSFTRGGGGVGGAGGWVEHCTADYGDDDDDDGDGDDDYFDAS